MIGNMMQNGELTARGRLAWLLGALLVGLASQYCVNFGVCALPLQ